MLGCCACWHLSFVRLSHPFKKSVPKCLSPPSLQTQIMQLGVCISKQSWHSVLNMHEKLLLPWWSLVKAQYLTAMEKTCFPPLERCSGDWWRVSLGIRFPECRVFPIWNAEGLAKLQVAQAPFGSLYCPDMRGLWDTAWMIIKISDWSGTSWNPTVSVEKDETQINKIYYFYQKVNTISCSIKYHNIF